MLLVNPQCIFTLLHQRKTYALGSLDITLSSNLQRGLKTTASQEPESKAVDIKGEKLNKDEAILVKYRITKVQQRKKRCLVHCKTCIPVTVGPAARSSILAEKPNAKAKAWLSNELRIRGWVQSSLFCLASEGCALTNPPSFMFSGILRLPFLHEQMISCISWLPALLPSLVLYPVATHA